MMELEFAKREHEYNEKTNENKNAEQQQDENKNNNEESFIEINNQNNGQDEIKLDETQDTGVSLNCGLTFKPMHTDWRKFIIN